MGFQPLDSERAGSLANRILRYARCTEEQEYATSSTVSEIPLTERSTLSTPLGRRKDSLSLIQLWPGHYCTASNPMHVAPLSSERMTLL